MNPKLIKNKLKMEEIVYYGIIFNKLKKKVYK